MFRDRTEAGKKLGEVLKKYSSENPLVLALPRGGVVTGYEIAKKLKSALDVLIVRKIGSPQNLEFGIGAVAEGNIVVWDTETVKARRYSDEILKSLKDTENREVLRRKKVYRQNRAIRQIKDKVIILVDDGVATGVTTRAAIKAVLSKKPKKLIFATPVCALESIKSIERYVDEFVCLIASENLTSIGAYYQDFSQVTDERVVKLLKEA